MFAYLRTKFTIHFIDCTRISFCLFAKLFNLLKPYTFCSLIILDMRTEKFCRSIQNYNIFLIRKSSKYNHLQNEFDLNTFLKKSSNLILNFENCFTNRRRLAIYHPVKLGY